jgi:signal peptidase II
LKKIFRHNSFLLLVAALVIALDQWSKELVRAALDWNDSFQPLPSLGNFFRIVNWKNTGAAFGLFQDGNTILAVFALIITVIIIVYYQSISEKDWLAKVALSLQLGGAIGNLIDRLTQGFVTDFLAFGNFPVFNVADSAVTVGVALLILAYYLQEKRAKSAQNLAADVGSNAEAEVSGHEPQP